ncbi:D-alanyl-D-alanine carboxypeptidase/D-alanyl-D-alanine-endopeptidase [Acidovorax kalamii]|uniref:D-alanyl-D-alanine carboxypeptidase/D-alanyl-D-alanine-endopeptidase n=1 Tax=Acidovorax kalamii TaxID=2004485 RepID=A0A235EFN9_9BURK|nr:D-alanyl-D-alanine carboxypeptidase/D-alanyl-D-alanine-endopeptidase [Acidovorax kalamii]OYD47834.1 D-alanyl-D-alanine carboxypeptidase/D-alanyl-D-alanine-endopeptidase [Acidovorax kalamii]
MLSVPVVWRSAAPRGVLLGAMLWLALAGGAGAQAPAPSPSPLPAEVEAALARARLPREALSVLVVDAQGSARTAPRLAHRAQVPVNPASVMKLVTTYAALEQLGPAYVWNTPVYLQGTVQDGSLRGNVYIQGQGDPKLVMERLWLLMRRLQGQGIQVIVGDIVLDRTAFDLPEQDPARFDGEPLRPYNAAPDALLLNFKSSVMTFVPDAAAGLARIQYDPPLAGVQRQATVALAAPGTECGDWRGALRAELSDPAKVGFQGVYPAACGERVWPVAAADPRGFAARAVEGMWRELGGKLTGTVRDGKVPAGLKPAFVVTSPALAEVVRDVNKYSNNVMAQQVFLTLALQKNGVATYDSAREALRQWWQGRLGDVELPQVDNGAGLSRDARLTAQALARMLQLAWASPSMPELLASLPISGVDGTLRRSQSRAGTAHLKTGSLRDVMAIAGYVHAASGRRYVLVAVVNHVSAGAARPVLDSLIDWTARDQ